MRLRTPGRNGYASTSMMRRQPARTGRPVGCARRARAPRGYGHRAPPPSRSARRWAAPAPRNTPPPRHSRRWAWRWPTPVVATVLAAVLDQPQPGLARPQGAPQILVGLRRHVRVTDDVMRLADQLFAGEAADLDEGGIGIENPAFGVSARDEVLILTQLGFHIVDGKVHSHSQSPVASYGEERFHDGKHAGPARCAGLSPSGP